MKTRGDIFILVFLKSSSEALSKVTYVCLYVGLFLAIICMKGVGVVYPPSLISKENKKKSEGGVRFFMLIYLHPILKSSKVFVCWFISYLTRNWFSGWL